MGLPSYVINRDELEQIIKESLINTSISIEAEMSGSIDNEGLDLDLDLEKIKETLDPVMEVLSKQEIAINDLYSSIFNFSIELSRKLEQNEEFANSVSSRISLLIAEKRKIKELAQKVYDSLKTSGNHRTFSFSRFITENSSSYVTMYSPDYDESHLTSITISQNNFHYLDYWSLQINSEIIFDSIYCKGVNEKKNFSPSLKLERGDTIRLTFFNLSGKSKTINYDIDLLITS